jgi:hypothetical protein
MAANRKDLQKQSNYFLLGAVVLWVVLNFIARVLIPEGSVVALFLMPFWLVALVLWVIGCMRYAQSKGYSSLYGFLGILTICGLLVLVLLPNKWVEEGPASSPTNYPRPPQA